jgi:hypothetical protein
MNEKASILFIMTGLGKYSWYKLPFIKGVTFCTGLPQVLSWHIGHILKYMKGKCKCKAASCKWVSVLGVSVGLCKDGKEIFGRKGGKSEQ